MRPLFIATAVLALGPLAATAQENTPLTPPPSPSIVVTPSDEPEWTLESLIERARTSSPRLQISRENLAVATQRYRAARAFPNPTLQIVPGFSGSRNARDEEIIVAQPLDVFGLRRARAQVAAAEQRRAAAENTLTSRSLFIDIKLAAAQLYAAQENEKLEQAQVEIARLFQEAAQKRAALGDVPPIQVQRAELELLRAQNNLVRIRANRLARRSTLNLLTGAAPDAPLRVVLDLETPSATPTLAGTRPDIISAQATLESRQAQARALRRANYPTVQLQARRDTVFSGGGSTALRAVVTLPLFDFGNIRNERRALEASARAQAAALQLLNQQAAVQTEIARTQLESFRESATRYRQQLLPLTLDLLRKTQLGYAQGASTYLEVLEAQRTMRQMQTEYVQALTGLYTNETALDAALNGGALNLDFFPLPSREVTLNESQ